MILPPTMRTKVVSAESLTSTSSVLFSIVFYFNLLCAWVLSNLALSYRSPENICSYTCITSWKETSMGSFLYAGMHLLEVLFSSGFPSLCICNSLCCATFQPLVPSQYCVRPHWLCFEVWGCGKRFFLHPLNASILESQILQFCSLEGFFPLHHFQFRKQDFLNWKSRNVYCVACCEDLLPANITVNSPDSTEMEKKIEWLILEKNTLLKQISGLS